MDFPSELRQVRSRLALFQASTEKAMVSVQFGWVMVTISGK
jgi:hypothetical protein